MAQRAKSRTKHQSYPKITVKDLNPEFKENLYYKKYLLESDSECTPATNLTRAIHKKQQQSGITQNTFVLHESDKENRPCF